MAKPSRKSLERKRARLASQLDPDLVARLDSDTGILSMRLPEGQASIARQYRARVREIANL